MQRSILFLISSAAMLLLAGCPKPGAQPAPGVCGGFAGATCPADQ